MEKRKLEVVGRDDGLTLRALIRSFRNTEWSNGWEMLGQDALWGRAQRPHCQRQRGDQAHSRAISSDAQRPSGLAALQGTQGGLRGQREVNTLCCSSMHPQSKGRNRKPEGYCLKWKGITFQFQDLTYFLLLWGIERESRMRSMTS